MDYDRSQSDGSPSKRTLDLAGITVEFISRVAGDRRPLTSAFCALPIDDDPFTDENLATAESRLVLQRCFEKWHELAAKRTSFQPHAVPSEMVDLAAANPAAAQREITYLIDRVVRASAFQSLRRQATAGGHPNNPSEAGFGGNERTDLGSFAAVGSAIICLCSMGAGWVKDGSMEDWPTLIRSLDVSRRNLSHALKKTSTRRRPLVGYKHTVDGWGYGFLPKDCRWSLVALAVIAKRFLFQLWPVGLGSPDGVFLDVAFPAAIERSKRIIGGLPGRNTQLVATLTENCRFEVGEIQAKRRRARLPIMGDLGEEHRPDGRPVQTIRWVGRDIAAVFPWKREVRGEALGTLEGQVVTPGEIPLDTSPTGRPAIDVTEPPRYDEALVTLDQCAGYVKKSKAALVYHRDQGHLPEPDVKGGPGQAHKWRWAKIKPWLEKTYGTMLPHSPHDWNGNGAN